MYADAQAKEKDAAGEAKPASEDKKDDGNVVDAEYTEVKDKNKKAG